MGYDLFMAFLKCVCGSWAWATAYLSACAIGRFSRTRQQPAYDLANQNATSHLRQSGRVSYRLAYAAKGEFYSHSRTSRENTHVSHGWIVSNA